MDRLYSSAWRALAASQLSDAQRAFTLVVARDPGRGEAWFGLALALWRDGDRFAALGAARKSVEVTPALAKAQVVFAAIQRQIGDVEGAIRTLEIARDLEPAKAATLRLLADVYRRGRRPADALQAAKLALRLEPSSLESVVSLGDALLANELLVEAEKTYRVALALDRGAVRAAFGLGRLALARADWHAARAAFERARDISPGDPDTRYNVALLDLRCGRYREGFAAYPAIMDTDSDGARYYYHYKGVPRWNGEAPAGRRIVIASDQGLGDHIMMARFFERLPQSDPAIVVETPPELMGLFGRNFSHVRFEHFTHWRPVNTLDLHLPIMQLPCVAGITAESDIPGDAYLHADPQRVQEWRARLGAGRHVGIVWHGNEKNTRERWRAAPLRHWEPLARVPEVHFHSLQRDATQAELSEAPFPLAPLPAPLRTMDDTAALMTALEGVVSVDTATVHLAGALGRPTWLANPLVSDFRWGLDRSDSPWYSSLRIVRQTASDDWAPVFQTIAAELEGRSSSPPAKHAG